MKPTRPGCFSSVGLGATLITVLLILVVLVLRGNRLFSPGSLNAVSNAAVLGGVRSHAEIGGNCGACHSSPWSSDHMADRCLNCHVQLKSSKQNFHQVMIIQGMTTGCFTCHTEHNGADASLTQLAIQNFPHDQAGFSLAAHQTKANGTPFACADCHGTELKPVIASDCVLCHNQIDPGFVNNHLNDFGDHCLDCHDGIDRFTNFDHQLAAFKLTGKHDGPSCSECHSGATNLQDLKDTSQVCIGCHAADDTHNGSFGSECASCHTPDGWSGGAFDHGLTGFPLEGKHAGATCDDCHLQGGAGKIFKGTPQACNACHAQDDPHAGQFGDDCSACHSPEGWKPATFDHSKGIFPLSGKHLQVACDGCHVNQIFSGTPQACSACHQEPDFHLGLFGSSCNECHTTEGWAPASFDQVHSFPINHGSRDVNTCQTCHETTLSTYTCYGCHEHTPQNVTAKHSEEGIRDLTNCARCHLNGAREGGEGGED